MNTPAQTHQPKDFAATLYTLAAALCFTIMNVCIKEAGSRFGFNTAELVFWRMLFATLVLGGIAIAQGKSLKTQHLKAHMSRSIAGTLGMLCIFYAIVHLPLATGVTLSYTSSIFLALLSIVVLHEKLSFYKQIMVGLGFLGVVVLLQPSFRQGQEVAALIGLLGGLFAGWAYMMVRELSVLGEPSWRVVFYLSFVGTIIGAVWATLTGWHRPEIAAWPYIIGIGGSALIAQLCLTHAYKVGDKLTVASWSYATVIFATFAGMWLFGDTIGWHEWLGMGIIIAAGILNGIDIRRLWQR